VTRFDIAHCFRTYTLTLPNILDCIGRFDAAAEALGEALRLAPKHSGYLTNLGLIQQRQHKLDEAEQTFGAVLANDPSYALAGLGLCNALRELGRPKKGVPGL